MKNSKRHTNYAMYLSGFMAILILILSLLSYIYLEEGTFIKQLVLTCCISVFGVFVIFTLKYLLQKMDNGKRGKMFSYFRKLIDKKVENM